MGNPKKSGKRVTEASAWKGKKKGEPLDLPSGNTALVRAVGMETFVERGFIPNSLLPIIQEAISKGKAPKMKEMEITPETLREMSQLMDAVCIYCVLEPEVSKVPEEGEPRDDDKLYVDEVDLQDKTFIFQYAVGGTRDLEQFREGLSEGVGAVPAGAEPESSTE